MKKILTVFFASSLLCGIARAQNATPAPSADTTIQGHQPVAGQQTAQPSPQSATMHPSILRIAPGSVIPVQLTKTIDSKKAKPGEEIEAKVTQDMKNGSGEILVPKDTKVIGRVTEAQRRTKEEKESQIGISFERAVMNGSDVPMPMSIQAIIVASSSNPTQNAAGENADPMSVPSGGEMPQGPSGRAGGMGSDAPQPAPTTSRPGSDWPNTNQTKTNARQPITGNTQGVIGDPNLRLSSATTSAQSSVVSSEKDNVKLESGTMMLLRVVQ
jgi:hypothetical protein